MSFQEREALKKMYPPGHQRHVSWKEKVDKMPDRQVIAIYLRLKSQGRLPR